MKNLDKVIMVLMILLSPGIWIYWLYATMPQLFLMAWYFFHKKSAYNFISKKELSY